MIFPASAAAAARTGAGDPAWAAVDAAGATSAQTVANASSALPEPRPRSTMAAPVTVHVYRQA
ncbi:hypothetical protein Ait01nite_014930 [Actinoplanes italicus]|nr:hypothetical protein Ait01nite_014930 [Actinoplanes italicus]